MIYAHHVPKRNAAEQLSEAVAAALGPEAETLVKMQR
jgi:hypothetical protein